MKRFIITDTERIENISHCMGCFGCFVKDPGKCVIKDEFEDNGVKLGNCEEFIIISECVYGGYSPKVKIQLDRCLPFLHADFTVADGEMHHALRYETHPKIAVYFYGENISEKEREVAQRLVDRNLKNFGFVKEKVVFCKSADEAFEIING